MRSAGGVRCRALRWGGAGRRNVIVGEAFGPLGVSASIMPDFASSVSFERTKREQAPALQGAVRSVSAPGQTPANEKVS